MGEEKPSQANHPRRHLRGLFSWRLHLRCHAATSSVRVSVGTSPSGRPKPPHCLPLFFFYSPRAPALPPLPFLVAFVPKLRPLIFAGHDLPKGQPGDCGWTCSPLARRSWGEKADACDAWHEPNLTGCGIKGMEVTQKGKARRLLMPIPPPPPPQSPTADVLGKST